MFGNNLESTRCIWSISYGDITANRCPPSTVNDTRKNNDDVQRTLTTEARVGRRLMIEYIWIQTVPTANTDYNGSKQKPYHTIQRRFKNSL